MKKYTNDELLRMDAVEVYKLRLDRKFIDFQVVFGNYQKVKKMQKNVLYIF